MYLDKDAGNNFIVRELSSTPHNNSTFCATFIYCEDSWRVSKIDTINTIIELYNINSTITRKLWYVFFSKVNGDIRS